MSFFILNSTSSQASDFTTIILVSVQSRHSEMPLNSPTGYSKVRSKAHRLRTRAAVNRKTRAAENPCCESKFSCSDERDTIQRERKKSR